MVEMRDAYIVLVRELERKRPLVRSVLILENSIRMYLREIGVEGVDCNKLAQDMVQLRSLVNTLLNVWVP
jgi:hypothetical protein